MLLIEAMALFWMGWGEGGVGPMMIPDVRRAFELGAPF